MTIKPEELRAYIEAQDPRTVHRTLGIRFVDWNPEALTLELDVDERLFQHAGIVHGGVYVLLGESAASTASAFEVDIERYNVAGMAVNANHLRPSTSGTLRCTARPIHKGKTSLVYGFEVTNDGESVSVGRVTMAVRERTQPAEK
jgi:uncharacterized protein (TIGR00369 family)